MDFPALFAFTALAVAVLGGVFVLMARAKRRASAERCALSKRIAAHQG